MPPVRRNRRRYDSNINHDRWLISYADFVTLLFAFFTTMYAISTVDAKKLQEMVESMQAAFDASKVPPPKRPLVKPDTTAVKVPTPDQLALQALKARLSERLKLQISGGQVGLEVDPRGLVVSIREAGTFGVGSAELSDSARSVLGEVADAPERWDDVLDAFVARRRSRVDWVREQTHLRISQATAGPTALASTDAQAGALARFCAYYAPLKAPP